MCKSEDHDLVGFDLINEGKRKTVQHRDLVIGLAT
jgi:hypothetical protein